MAQTKSKLTLFLKIYAVLVVIYSAYACINTVYAYLQSSNPFLLISMGGLAAAVVVNSILLWIIFRNKDVTALFLPCLLIGVVLVLEIAARFVFVIFANGYMNIAFAMFWNAVGAAIFLLIAFDAKRGSKYALAESVSLVAYKLAGTVFGLFQFIISFLSYSRMSESSPTGFLNILLNNMLYAVLSLFLSSSALIFLMLLRSLITRKRQISQPQQYSQPRVDNSGPSPQ